MSRVTAIPCATPSFSKNFFENCLQLETDCWDVHHAISTNNMDFVLIDVRGLELYKKGHIQGAIHLPYAKIIASKIAQYPASTIFVTYCAGPHCNAAIRGALRFAELNRSVKVMMGGITGWLDEGFSLESSK